MAFYRKENNILLRLSGIHIPFVTKKFRSSSLLFGDQLELETEEITHGGALGSRQEISGGEAGSRVFGKKVQPILRQ